jgi:uncharacterized membrane protein
MRLLCFLLMLGDQVSFVAIGIPLAVTLIGLLVYLIAVKPKIENVGRLMFMIGLAIFLWCACNSGAGLLIGATHGK